MIDYTKNWKRERQFNPKLCQEDTFVTKIIDDDLELVLCKKKGENKQSVQSIRKRR